MTHFYGVHREFFNNNPCSIAQSKRYIHFSKHHDYYLNTAKASYGEHLDYNEWMYHDWLKAIFLLAQSVWWHLNISLLDNNPDLLILLIPYSSWNSFLCIKFDWMKKSSILILSGTLNTIAWHSIKFTIILKMLVKLMSIRPF